MREGVVWIETSDQGVTINTKGGRMNDATERHKRYRERMREKGYRQVAFWLNEEEEAAVKNMLSYMRAESESGGATEGPQAPESSTPATER